MAVTREMIEAQIAAIMKKGKGKSRKEAVDEKMKGAKKGAFRAEKEVVHAEEKLRDAQAGTTKLTQEEVEKLQHTIANEGRLAANENQTIAILKRIIEDDKKKQ